MEWPTATRFWAANRYNHSKTELVELTLDGIRVRHEVANGAEAGFRKTKTLDSASPNFIHSLDAAHLIRTVLAANREDIRDILTVHDNYACLAPHAQRFGQLIRRELLLLHLANPLDELRRANIRGEKQLDPYSPFAALAPLLLEPDAPTPPSPPKLGDLDLFALQHGEYSFA